MIEELAIRQKLQGVAKDEVSLFDFADWLDSNSWNLHRDSSVSVQKLVSSIDRVFAEYDYHHNEVALRRELFALVPYFELAVFIESDRVTPVQLPRTRSAHLTVWAPQLAFAEA